MTVSSLPKLGHMLVLCLRRFIMCEWEQCGVERTEREAESLQRKLALILMRRSNDKVARLDQKGMNGYFK